MKAPFSSNFSSKTLLALAFSLILVGTSAVLFGGFAEKGIGATGSSGGSGGSGIGGEGSESGGEGNGGGGGGSPTPLCGFAWGATDQASNPKIGAGWVSFNSSDCDTNEDGVFSAADGVPGCPTSGTAHEYHVSVQNNGDITGYAWSSNLGWIKFGSLTGMPQTPGNSSSGNAKVTGNGDLTGWARACAGTASGDCSSSTSRTDGWDGWISLTGTALNSENYKVRFNSSTEKFSGFSWGGSVVGWLKWDSTSNDAVRYCGAETVGVSLSATPPSGPASPTSPLSVTLTATPSPLSGGGTYRFKCDISGSLSAPQSNNTFPCSTFYQLPGRDYTPLVEFTRVTPQGVLQATSTATVSTDESQTPGELEMTCDVSPKPVPVNQAATWTASIDTVGIAPFHYVFSFLKEDGETLDEAISPNPVLIGSSFNTSESVIQTYSTLGNKKMSVDVRDSAPVPASGTCETSVGVVVRPTIIEI